MLSARSILATVILASTPVWAQSGGLRVVVVDASDDEPVPGATVTLSSSVQLVPETSVLSDAGGEVTFPVLRPGGGYVVEVAMAGFATRRVPDLRVKHNITQTVTVSMTEEMTEVVEVRAATEVVDLDDLRGTTKFGSEFIQDLPVEGRFYTNVLVLAPGVQDADGDGNPNVHGARERDFQAIVGGVSNVDPLTGLRLSELNFDSIEEIEVVATGAGVEYGRAQGGFANIIEKQGTNRFEGLFNFIYRTSALDGNGATGVSDERTPDFEWIQPAIQISGPIVKDRAWFRLSSELIDRQDPIDTLGGISTIDTRQVNNSAIVTWQVSRRNRLAFSYLNAPLRIENVGVDSTTPIESTNIFEFEGPTWRVGWTAPYSSRLLVESLVAFQDGSHKTLPTTTGVANDCVLGADFATQTRCLNTNTGLTSGSFPYTWKDKRQRLTVRSQVDYFGGRFWGSDHHFKFGFAVENERYERTLDRQPDLTFSVYPGLEPVGIMFGRFAVPQTSEAKATGTNVAVFAEDRIRPRPNLTVTVGLRVDREQIDSPGFEPLDLSSEAAALFEQVNPLLMAGANENVVALTMRQTMPQVFTAYEDVERFTLELAELMGIPANQAFTGLNSYSTQSVSWNAHRRPENIAITNINPAPFLGIAWDPFKTGKTKIAATAGRHYDKIFLAVPLIEMEPVTTDLSFRAWWWRGNWYVVDPCTAWTACFNPGVNTRVVDRDLRTPYQDELTLSVEREIAPETAIRFLYVHRDFEDQLQDVDVNHLPGDFGRCGIREGGHAVMIPTPGDGQTVTDPWSGESYIDTDPGIGDGRVDDCVGSRLPGISNTEGPDGITDLYIQNPAWGEFFIVGNFNTTEYEAFVIEITRRQYRNWQMNASYTWSEAVGDAEDFSQALGDDVTLLDDERGFLSYDQRQVFKFNATTIVPWAGGFRFGAAVQWQSGLPYSLLNRTAVRDTMPPYLGDVGVEPRVRLQYETGQRNTERNESWWNVDLHLAKEFRVNKRVEMQVSLDVFNLLNDNSLRVLENVNGTSSAVRRFGRQFQLGLRVAF